MDDVPNAHLAVIVGTDLTPSRARRVNGITIRTLWGDMAAQLGGREGYEIVKEADETGTSPGADDLVTLFNEFGPAVILIDELVAYVRNIYEAPDRLPAGSFDSNLTFVQALTDAVDRSERSQLVTSIPESASEIGGQGGQVSFSRIGRIFARVEDILGDQLLRVKDLRLCAGGCSHLSEMKLHVKPCAERLSNYTTRTHQNFHPNVAKRHILIDFVKHILFIRSCLTGSMTTGLRLKLFREPVVCCV